MSLLKMEVQEWQIQYKRCCSENTAVSTRSFFTVTGVLKYAESWQNWMAANFNVRKIRHTVQRMHGCEYSIEIIIVPLKDRITETNFFMWGTGGDKYSAERITQTIIPWKVSVFGDVLVRIFHHSDQNNSEYEHF